LPAIGVEVRTNDVLSFKTLDERTVRLLPLALGTVIEERPRVRRPRVLRKLTGERVPPVENLCN
jgi:hypothetical protein